MPDLDDDAPKPEAKLPGVGPPAPERDRGVPRTRRALSKVPRELALDEWSQPAVQKLMMDEVERLEDELCELQAFRDKYYTEARMRAVADEKVKSSTAFDVLVATALTAGGALLGASPSIWGLSAAARPYAVVAMLVGVLLLIGAVSAAVVKR